MTTIEMTDPAILPQWKGRPVPWIARWTGEIHGKPAKVSMEVATGELLVSYEDGLDNREAGGILWIREGTTRAGEPQYAQVNTYRQRLAMRKQRCQVCGEKIDERPIRWLIPDAAIQHTASGIITNSAPTCSPCIPLALEVCPHLKRGGWKILKVLDYHPAGVQGLIIYQDEQGQVQQRNATVAYGALPEGVSARCVVAKQQIVLITKFVVEEESP